MRTTLHIFKKDARRLWYEILVVLALTALFAWIEPRTPADLGAGSSQNGLMVLGSILRGLLPMAWWYLIARAIHQEAIPGDRQYWLTRPIAWRHLLGAKLLFILAFINLPVVVSDCAILLATGFNPVHYLPGLLTKQLLFTAIYLAPALTLALVTTGLAQMVLCCLGISVSTLAAGLLAGPLGWNHASNWTTTALLGAVLLATAAAVLLLLYRSRNVTLARAVVVCAAMFAPLLPYHANLHRANCTSDIHAVFDRTPPPPFPAPKDASFVPIQFTIRLDGVPAVLQVASDLLDVGAHDHQDGFRSFGHFPGNSLEYRNDKLYATLYVPRSVFDHFKDRVITLDTSLSLTLVRVKAFGRFPAGVPWIQLSGIGSCGAYPGASFGYTDVQCRFPFRAPARARVRLTDSQTGERTEEVKQIGEDSPLPASLGISPLEKVVLARYAPGAFDPGRLSHADVVISTEQPVAYFHRDLETPDIRLADYAVPRTAKLK
jgi:hypothetical protein